MNTTFFMSPFLKLHKVEIGKKWRLGFVFAFALQTSLIGEKVHPILTITYADYLKLVQRSKNKTKT